MSVVPNGWSEPGSRSGLLYELGWIALCAVVFGALAAFEPLFFEGEPTTTVVAGSVALGAAIGAGLVYASCEVERVRSFWSDARRRFLALFVSIMVMQGVMRLFPTWFVLTALAASLVAVPARVAVYYRYRDRPVPE
jgi:integral membrane sensor domain MASE1